MSFILTIRTDKPEAEIGLYEDKTQLAYETWAAHRELSSTILTKIEHLLKQQGKTWQDIGGVAVYKGPGSFTGLRIGFSVANTLASQLDVPLIGTNGETWIDNALAELPKTAKFTPIAPDYGSDPHITTPKK